MDYNDALKLFYNLDAHCPSCNKKTISRSEIEEAGRTIYKMKCTSCGWKLNITLPIYINVFKQLYDAEKQKLLIISQLSSDNLKEKKAEYKTVKDSIGKLEKIVDDANSNIKKYDSENLRLITDMTKSYIERKHLFSSIADPTKITNDIRNKFVQIIKDEGKISDKRLGEIVKSLAPKIDKKDAEKYFKWLTISNDYIGLSEKLKELHKVSLAAIDSSKNIPLNYMSEPAKVSESTTREKIAKEGKESIGKPQIKTINISLSPIDNESNTGSPSSNKKNIIISPELLKKASDKNERHERNKRDEKKKTIRIKRKDGGYRYITRMF